MYVYIYIYVYVCMYVCMYIYTHYTFENRKNVKPVVCHTIVLF